jgi:acetate kinase
MNGHILCLNTGSSSLRFALYDASDLDHFVIRGAAERVGLKDSRITIENAEQTIHDWQVSLPTYEKAWLESLSAINEMKFPPLAACVHRVVHGGPNLTQPRILDQKVRQELENIIPLAPLHLPSELKIIDLATL